MSEIAPPPSRARVILNLIGIVVAANVLAWLVYKVAGAQASDFDARIAPLMFAWIGFIAVAPVVGYGRFEAAIYFWIPVYDFFFTTRVLWRLANLPNRYWEHSRTRTVRSPNAEPRSSHPEAERPLVPPAEMED